MKNSATSKKSGFTIVDLIVIIAIIATSLAILYICSIKHGTGINKTEPLSVEQKLENAERTITELKASIAKSERAAIETLHRFNDEELLHDKVSIYDGSKTQRIYLLSVPFYKAINRGYQSAEPDFSIGNTLAAFARKIEGEEEIVSTIPFPTTHRETPHTQGVLIITKVISPPSAEKSAQ